MFITLTQMFECIFVGGFWSVRGDCSPDGVWQRGCFVFLLMENTESTGLIMFKLFGGPIKIRTVNVKCKLGWCVHILSLLSLLLVVVVLVEVCIYSSILWAVLRGLSWNHFICSCFTVCSYPPQVITYWSALVGSAARTCGYCSDRDRVDRFWYRSGH